MNPAEPHKVTYGKTNPGGVHMARCAVVCQKSHSCMRHTDKIKDGELQVKDTWRVHGKHDGYCYSYLKSQGGF